MLDLNRWVAKNLWLGEVGLASNSIVSDVLVECAIACVTKESQEVA